MSDFDDMDDYGWDDEEEFLDIESAAGSASESERARASTPGLLQVTVLDEHAAESRMDALISEVVSHIQPDTISVEAASALLRHASYDFGAAVSVFFSDERDTVLTKAGVARTAEEDDSLPPRRSRTPVLCGVCMCDSPASDTLALVCGHTFCLDCWKEVLKREVECMNGRVMHCPQYVPAIKGRCKQFVPAKVIERVAGSEVFARYKHFLARSFWEQNRGVKPCPNPLSCKYVIELNEKDSRVGSVQCECGHRFCFLCSAEPHHPVSCDGARRWLSEQCATEMYLRSKFMQCPTTGCGAWIERIEGCNALHCGSRVGCNKTFCYECGGPWEPGHQSHFSCSDPYDLKKKGGGFGKNRTAKFVRMYRAHDDFNLTKRLGDAQKLETALLASGKEAGHISVGIEEVAKAHRLLKYAVVALYQDDSLEEKYPLFAFQQEELRVHTEKTSDLMFNAHFVGEVLKVAMRRMEDVEKDRVAILTAIDGLRKHRRNMEGVWMKLAI